MWLSAEAASDQYYCFRAKAGDLRSQAIAARQVAALAGINVLLMDTNATALERSRDGIAASLQRAVGKKKLEAASAEAALARIATHREMEVRSPLPCSRCSMRCTMSAIMRATVAHVEYTLKARRVQIGSARRVDSITE